MPNNYFQFKEFTIRQEHCAMKVSTDACIQGAWTTIPPHAKRVLDVGTGTGLLSLMVAQKADGIMIDAVEMERLCAEQALYNINISPWKNRINFIKGDIRKVDLNNKYDLIICNPPFFNNSLKSPDEQRNTARHTDTLSYAELLEVFDMYSEKDGFVSVLLPVNEFKIFESLFSKRGWFLNEKLNIHPAEDKPANRVVAIISRQNASARLEDIYIRKAGSNEYTESFIELMKPYYLYL